MGALDFALLRDDGSTSNKAPSVVGVRKNSYLKDDGDAKAASTLEDDYYDDDSMLEPTADDKRQEPSKPVTVRNEIAGADPDIDCIFAILRSIAKSTYIRVLKKKGGRAIYYHPQATL